MTAVLATALAAAPGPVVAAAETDLDAFMRQVLAKRDDNWTKLQQYVLDEREQVQLTGPSRRPMWGDRRDYMWYLRDGFFVRSPVMVNGIAVGDAERRQYEAEYLRRAQQADPAAAVGPGPASASGDEQALVRQVRQPGFVSSAYFLRFRFEQGSYALVGHEPLAGVDTLRIEYYPTRLFARPQRWTEHQPSASRRAQADERERMMNKQSLVPLWIEPATHQILKYSFHNISTEFLPVSWLLHVNDAAATMTMAEAFPGVWLPAQVAVSVNLTIAIGQFDLRYDVLYHDYRQ
ncbi:MAG: hypothetical protein ABUS56_06185, partial [Acidobacteriota bacterium]